MSDEEREQFSSFQKDIKAIKRWMPVVSAILVAGSQYTFNYHNGGY